MSAFEHFIVFSLIQIILFLMFYYIGKNNDKEILKNIDKEHVIIKYPKAYIRVGIVDILFCSACLFFMRFFPNGTETWWVYIICISFDLLGIAISLNAFMWRIDIFKSEDYFLYRSLFKTYKIKYDDCLWYKYEHFNSKIKTTKQTIHIEIGITNLEYLLAMLDKHEIKELKKGNTKEKTKK